MRYARLDCFHYLLQAGAQPDVINGPCGGSLYHTAVRQSSAGLTFIQLLYEFGASLHFTDTSGRMCWDLDDIDEECKYFLQSCASQPRSLRSNTRISIRRFIGPSRIKFIKNLPVPYQIKHYLSHGLLFQTQDG